MRTANPALNEKTFNRYGSALELERADRMTLEGTSFKAASMLGVLVVAAAFTWSRTMGAESWAPVLPWVLGGAIGGLVAVIVMCIKPATSPFLALPYAAFEGLFLGAISAGVELMYPGIVVQAVALTLGTAGALLFAYVTRVVRATENFKLGVVAATGGIFLVYIATWILGMFGVGVPYIHGSGLIGIGFSVFVVIIAALNLVLDFDFIENGVEKGAPKYMEWFGAVGLMVTLVWLYIEILHLLMKLRNR